MDITITSRHYDLAPAVREYAEGKIQHLTTYFENLGNAHIIFALEKYRHFFEVTLHANGKDFNAKDESEDMFASIDRVTEKLERQILKYKGKLYKKKAPRLSAMEVELPEEAGEENPLDMAGEIVPADPVEFPVMTMDEAALRLRENGRHFSIFSNKATSRLTVLFEREDGTIGLIEA